MYKRQAKAGVALDLGADISAVMLAPLSSEYDDTNNYSAVIQLTYGGTSFLFTGDASTPSEKEMLKHYGAELKSDVLKVGHHGSRTATSKKFLDAVDRGYAVISYGKDNDYGHPTAEVLSLIHISAGLLCRSLAQQKLHTGKSRCRKPGGSSPALPLLFLSESHDLSPPYYSLRCV